MSGNAMPNISVHHYLAAVLVFALGMLLTATTSPILAQQAGTEPGKTPVPAPVPAVSTNPEITTATFGSWTLRCQASKDNAASRQCEIVQVIQAQGQTQGQNTTLAQYGLTQMEKGDQWRFVALLPVNIQFPSSGRLATGAKPPITVELAWQRCIAIGCAAASNLAPDMVAALRNAGEPGTVTYLDAAGRNIVLPVEFRGLSQAMDAFGK
jgi:invasion protein IalB